MAKPIKPRNWASLKPSTQKRYLGKGRALGQTEAQVQAHYTGGGNMGAHRGHRQHAGASERQWGALIQAAKHAKLDEDVDGPMEAILENVLSKGFTPAWILHTLAEKAESRDTYRSKLARVQRTKSIAAGWEPGRGRYQRRNLVADIELYYYH